MTYSIVARDPETGRFGIAIQTCWPFVGTECPWLESGVGGVVTQSFTDPAYGPDGLARLRARDAPATALAALLAADPGRDVRQVGLVDAAGRSAAHTGARCVAAAGHVVADGVAVQANMMERPTVWPAMLDAYQASQGPFADRLLAALRAAEAEGGDIRGRQSAALVVSGTPDEPGWKRSLDLRVDEHATPLDELTRLLEVQRGYDALSSAETLAAAGDLVGAEAASLEAGRLTPGDAQIVVWRAVGMAAAGRVAAGRDLLRSATAANDRWPEFLRRYAASGAQPELVDAAKALIET